MKAKINNWTAWTPETKVDVLYSMMADYLQKAGFRIEGEVHRIFHPYGFTALFLLAESHFAIHTFPECGISYLELSSCVDKPFDRFLDMVERGGVAIVSPIVRHSGDMGHEAD